MTAFEAERRCYRPKKSDVLEMQALAKVTETLEKAMAIQGGGWQDAASDLAISLSYPSTDHGDRP